MAFQEFEGSYTDIHGTEPVRWRLAGTDGYTVTGEVRGIMLQGSDFDDLQPLSPRAEQVGLRIDRPGFEGTVTDCVLRGDVPCRFISGGREHQEMLRFRVDLSRLDERVEPTEVDVAGVVGRSDSWFEDALLTQAAALPAGDRLATCFTCSFSDYSPSGHGMTGMSCHRDAKDQYLAVRTKGDYFQVPVTERVPEFHWCPEYRVRAPGTGYRG